MDETTTEEKKLLVHEYERFDIKIEAKVLKALSGIFLEMKNLVNEEEIINEENIAVCDPSHVCMVIAKTTRAKILLRRFFDPDNVPKVPHLDFSTVKGGGNSSFSTDFFLSIMKCLEHINDHFNVKMGVDNPCIIESEDFIFLLAPRIESE
jgi:hypothetical protein